MTSCSRDWPLSDTWFFLIHPKNIIVFCCHRLSISSPRWMCHCHTSVSIGLHNMFHAAISLHYSRRNMSQYFLLAGPMNRINHNYGKDLGDDDRVVQLQSVLKPMNIHYWNQGFRCLLTLRTILYNGCFTVSLIFLSNCSSSALVKENLVLILLLVLTLDWEYFFIWWEERFVRLMT